MKEFLWKKRVLWETAQAKEKKAMVIGRVCELECLGRVCASKQTLFR